MFLYVLFGASMNIMTARRRCKYKKLDVRKKVILREKSTFLRTLSKYVEILFKVRNVVPKACRLTFVQYVDMFKKHVYTV